MAMPETVEVYRHYGSEGAFQADQQAMERDGWSATSVQVHDVPNGPYGAHSHGRRATPR